MRRKIVLDGKSLDFEDLRVLARHPFPNEVWLGADAAALRRVARSRAVVERALREGRTVYGVNTGFGRLSDTRIEPDRLDELQRNLLLSHATGLGAPIREARLLIALRANSLLLGYSGVTPKLVRRLIDLFNSRVVPEILEQGSVGASA